ncbi:MAG: hypothetical protein ACRDNW_19930 [Trebonia sp.]
MSDIYDLVVIERRDSARALAAAGVEAAADQARFTDLRRRLVGRRTRRGGPADVSAARKTRD